MDHAWTVDKLIETNQHIKSADFKVEEVNVNQHNRVVAAISRANLPATT
jgi:hypothetical protein